MKVQVPSNELRIATMFDRIAARYDILNSLLSLRQDRRWRRTMIAQVPPTAGGTFIDVATGTGDVIIEAQRQRPEYKKFEGVDISNNMLALARLKAQKVITRSKLNFSLMSAENLQFSGNSADCITIAFGLRNVVDRERAIEEFHRVLKPSGRLLILEFFPPRNSLLAACFQFYFHRVLPFVGGLLSDRDAYRYLPESVAGFYNLEQLHTTLAEKGFVVESTKLFLFGGCCLINAQAEA